LAPVKFQETFKILHFYKTNLAILPPLKVKNTKYFELQIEDSLYKGTWMTTKFEVSVKRTNLHE
jgi:hypothetical protein